MDQSILDTLTALDEKNTKKEMLETIGKAVVEVEINKNQDEPIDLLDQAQTIGETIKTEQLYGSELKIEKSKIEELGNDQFKKVMDELDSYCDIRNLIGDHISVDSIAMIDSRLRPVGNRISNWLNKIFNLALSEALEIKAEKESITPKMKKHIESRNKHVGTLVNYWQGFIPAVITQWSEACRANGEKTDSIQVLADITKTTRRTIVEGLED